MAKADTKKEKKDKTKKKSDKKLAAKKEERAKIKSQKKKEKEELLAQVPTKDKDGISYTKIQIRRMVRRVKNGLPPVPTEEEENERRRQLKIEKKEEEEELAGMLYQKGQDDDDNDDESGGESANEEDEENSEKEEEEEEKEGGTNGEDKSDVNKEESDSPSTATGQKALDTEEENQLEMKPLKKKRRSKPVPEDYVCQACQNKIKPLHWIYDCPHKINNPGTNQKTKKVRGVNDPSSQKVFVSGLPFEAKASDVERYFESQIKGAKVINCKLHLFEDTKRCKGQGVVTFSNDESAKKALKMNGIVLDLGIPEEKKKKNGKKVQVKQKKELKLGVKKLLNRTVTKGPRKFSMTLSKKE